MPTGDTMKPRGPTADTHVTSTWTPRPGLWHAFRARFDAVLRHDLGLPLLALAVVLIALAVTVLVGMLADIADRRAIAIAQSMLLCAGVGFLVQMLHRLNTRHLGPLADIRRWVSQLRAGDLSARMPTAAAGEFATLAADINHLAGQLQTLSQNMNDQVRAQTMRLSRKTRSLEILYEVVASLNTARSTKDLLAYFLETLTELLDAQGATVSVLSSTNHLQPTASHGNVEHIITQYHLQDLVRTLSDSVAREGRLAAGGVPREERLVDSSRHSGSVMELIVVPLQYRDRILGVYALFLDQASVEWDEDFRDLLTSIGRHVGLALEKGRLDENARRLAIMEERDILRNELHDSLAQSLVSMRLQVKMLGEILYKKDVKSAEMEVRRLRSALEEAHTSLRQLLASFRTSMDERGLVPALEDSVQRFRENTGINAYFQHDLDELNLSPSQEVEVFRIAQEALSNIGRHSKAQTARIFLSGNADRYHLVIEDDGVGVSQQTSEPRRGEHIGLAIMQERAKRLRGILMVEGEPGEGTRVSLSFSSKRAGPAGPL